MKVNGNVVPLPASVTLAQWLDENGYRQGRIAVERNGEIVPKSHYSDVILKKDDRLEIVHFVGGG